MHQTLFWLEAVLAVIYQTITPLREPMQITSITPKRQQQAAGGHSDRRRSSAGPCPTAVPSSWCSLTEETTPSSASPTAIFLLLHYSRTNILSATKLHLLSWKSSHSSEAWFSWVRKIEILGRPFCLQQKTVTSIRENMAPPQLCLTRARKAWETHCSPMKEQHSFLSEMFISISTPQSQFLITGVFMGGCVGLILWMEKGGNERDFLTQWRMGLL